MTLGFPREHNGVMTTLSSMPPMEKGSGKR